MWRNDRQIRVRRSPSGFWVLPETFVRYGHCAPRCFCSYNFLFCVPCPTSRDRQPLQSRHGLFHLFHWDIRVGHCKNVPGKCPNSKNVPGDVP
nr:MAG TPA: hypothetical protein [Caudoviricetes sp.]